MVEEFLYSPYRIGISFPEVCSAISFSESFSLKIRLINPSISSTGVSKEGFSLILNSNNLGVPVLNKVSLAVNIGKSNASFNLWTKSRLSSILSLAFKIAPSISISVPPKSLKELLKLLNLIILNFSKLFNAFLMSFELCL